jgi:hypothetical protein
MRSVHDEVQESLRDISITDALCMWATVIIVLGLDAAIIWTLFG